MNTFFTGVFPKTGGLEPASSRMYTLVMAVCGVLTVAGVVLGVHALIAGHEHTFGVSREVPWGILIAAYVFFVVTSTGLCIVSSLGHVFGLENFNPIAKRAVFMSIITILAGFLVIAFEIENTWRMPVGNVVGANLTSNIWWMGTLYGAYLLFMICEFLMLQKNQHRLATGFGLAGLLSGIVAHSNLGAVFGLLNGREFWHGPYMPIYFIASAAMSGCVAIIFFTIIAHKFNSWQLNTSTKDSLAGVSRLAALFMAIIVFFTSWKLIAGITGHPPGKYAAMETLISGPYATNFWVGEVALGMLIPFCIIMAVKGKNITALFWASISALIGIFFMRYDLVIVGQLIPHFHGMGLVDYPELFTYSPRFHEYVIVISGLAFCLLGLLAGERLFRGHMMDGHH